MLWKYRSPREKALLFVLAAVLLMGMCAKAAGAQDGAQHNRFHDPDYSGAPVVSPYSLVGGTWYFRHDGQNIPVIDMRALNEPRQRWMIDRLRENPKFTARMLARVDRWELLALSCWRSGCGISFNSIHPADNGGSALVFPVAGDPTRIGKRSGFLGLGSRRSIGDSWTQEHFIADKAVREALLIRALYSSSRP